MNYITYFLSFFSIVGTALPFIHSPAWWIRVFDFPRLQVACICLLSLILCFVFLPEWNIYFYLLVSLLVVSFIYQLSHIIVYTPLYPIQAKKSNKEKSTDSFSLMVANILMTNKETEAFKKLVKENDPDLLLITEPDASWELALRPLEEVYPYTIKHPLENTYGMMLYSKLPLKNQQVNFLVEKDVPSFYAAVSLPSGSDFDLHCIHPRPPVPGSSSYERDTEILKIGKTVREKDRPAVVVGDLNDVGWSATTKRFQKYSRLADPRQGRGLFNTFNANNPLLRYPLDHIFYSENFGLINMQKLNNAGSDHFPMFIELSFEPTRDKIKNLPHLDKQDKEIIQETISR